VEFSPIISFAASEEERADEAAVPVPGPDSNLFYGAALLLFYFILLLYFPVLFYYIS
jgi:hypothetical protein